MNRNTVVSVASDVAADSLFVNRLSLHQFGTRLQARLDEAFAARLALTTPPAVAQPPMGGFDDAHVTAARLDTLRREYVARLDRLISALTATQTAVRDISERYRTADELALSDPATIGKTMEPVKDALNRLVVPDA